MTTRKFLSSHKFFPALLLHVITVAMGIASLLTPNDAHAAATNIFTTAGVSTNTVPTSVNRLIIKAWGAGGGSSSNGFAGNGGGGGFVYSESPVTPGQQIVVVVGQGGANSAPNLGGAGSGNTAGGAPGQLTGNYNSRGQGGQGSSVFYLSNGVFYTRAVAGAGGGAGLGASGGGAGQVGGNNNTATGGNPGINGVGGAGGSSGSPGANYNFIALTNSITALNLAAGNGGAGANWSGGGGGGFGGGGGGGGGVMNSGHGAGGAGGGSYGFVTINGNGFIPGSTNDIHYASPAGFGGIPSGLLGNDGISGRVVLIYDTILPPSATTAVATALSPSTAQLNGSVNPSNAVATYYFQYGTALSYGSFSPPGQLSVGVTPVAVNAAITNLTPGTTYNFRVVASNAAGTTFGNNLTFTTPPNTNANLAALVFSGGPLSPAFSPIVTTYAGTSGVASVTVTPTSADANASLQLRLNGGSFSSTLSGQSSTALPLVPGTNTLDVRVTAQDAVTIKTYTISAVWSDAPDAVTLAASSIGMTTATANGTLNPNNAPTTYYFQYGPTLSYGSFSATNTASGISTVSVNAAFPFLQSGTPYNYRLVASNAKGTTNAANVTFTTLSNNVASLFSLAFSAGTFTPAFVSGTTNYSVTTNLFATSGTVTATASDYNMTLRLRFNGGTYSALTSGSPSATLNFKPGTNLVEVEVTAQDAVTVRVYSIGFNAVDTTPPVVSCPALLQTNATVGSCARALSYSVPVTDNFGSATVIYSPPSGTTFNVGSNYVTVTAYDTSGNTNACGFPLVLYPFNYSAPPAVTFSGATNRTVAGFVSGPVPVSYTVTASSFCPPALAVACVPPSGSSFPTGTNLVSCTTTDMFGVSTQTTFNVIVQLMAPSIALGSPGSITSTGAQLNASIIPRSDDTSWYFEYGLTPSFGSSSPTNVLTAGNSSVPVSFTLTDITPKTQVYYRLVASNQFGTTNSTLAAVITQDTNAYLSSFSISSTTLAPAFAKTHFLYFGTSTVASVTVNNVAEGVGAIRSMRVNGGSYFFPSTSQSLGLTYFITNTIDVRVVAQDGVTTNIYSAQVYLPDGVPPVISVPGNMLITLPTNICSTTVNFGGVNASDNTDPSPVLSVTPASGSSFSVGSNKVTCVAHDVYGNYSTNFFYITVRASVPGLTEGGEIWTGFSGVTGISPSTSWRAIALSANGTRGLVGGSNIPLYSTYNGGTNWVVNGLGTAAWNALALSGDGSRQFAAINGGPVYVSSNFGTNWTSTLGSAGWLSLACSQDGLKVYNVGGGLQIWASYDGGNTWFARENTRSWQAIACSANGTNVVGLASGTAVLVSTDSALSWSSRLFTANWTCGDMSVSGQVVGVAGNGTSIYISTNGGINWTTNMTSRTWTSLKCTGDGQKWLASSTDGFISQSLDGGVTWFSRLGSAGTTYLDYTTNGSRAVALSTGYGGLYSVPMPTSVPSTNPPSLLNVTNLSVTSTNPAGTIVNFSVGASNVCQPNLLVTYVPPSGSLIAPGVTNIVCTTKDQFGTVVSSNFTLTITAPPLLSALSATIGTNSTYNLPNALLKATVNPNGLPSTAFFLYGLTPPGSATLQTGFGPTYNASNYQAQVDPLIDGVNYYWLAIASNSAGVTVSSTQYLSTPFISQAGDANRDGVVSSNEVNTVLANYFSATYMTNPASGPDGWFQFNITDPVGFGLSVQGSSDLVMWTNLPNAAYPTYQFQDPDATNSLQRYYRLR